MKHAIFALTLLSVVAPSASAQVTHVFRDPPNFQFNAADCESESEEFIDWDVQGDASYKWSLVLHDRPASSAGQVQCPDLNQQDPARVVIGFEEDGTPAINGLLDFDFNILPRNIMPVDACESGGGLRGNYILCLYVTDLGAPPDVLYRSNHIDVNLDTEIPSTPTVSDLVPGDRKLTVSLSDANDEGVITYFVQHRPCDGGGTGSSDGGTAGTSTRDGGTGGTVVVTDDIPSDGESECGASGLYITTEFATSDIVLDGLSNGEEYEVRVTLRDDFGNVGDPSEPAVGTPQAELTPLSMYDGASNPLSVRGPEISDCVNSSLGSTSLFGALALLLLALRRRRRPRGRAVRRGLPLLLTLLTLGAASFAAPEAQAYTGQLTLGLKGGLYHPAIDTETVDGEPIYPIYKCFFDDQNVIQFGADFDMHLFDAFGSLEAGLGLGAMQARGMSLPLEAASEANRSAGRCSGEGTDSVELTLLAVRPGVTYRFDPLLDYFWVPFVPYARVGLVGMTYAFTRNGTFDNGQTKGDDPQNPLGVRFGWDASLGMMLALDFIDVIQLWNVINTGELKWTKRPNQYLEHTYLFGEVVASQVDTFGQPGLKLGPDERLLNTRLPWTFNFGVSVEFK